MTSLAADIGGTYSRLAWIDDDGRPESAHQSFANTGFASLEDVIAQGLALRGTPGQPIDDIVLAVPGPVHEDPVALTNIDWRIHRAALQQRFGARRLTVVNDFQAAALGALAIGRDSLIVLNEAAVQDGPVIVAGAGTGLGMAWLPRADHDGLPQPTEGGHQDFAPNDAREVALYEWLAARHGHVSYERIVSGTGLVDTYRFLNADQHLQVSPRDIVEAAREGKDAANQAIQLFVSVFAAYAGNMALAFGPTGGIYLCGGLASHLADWFDPAAVAARFTDKGRMRDNVKRIPLFLANSHNAGLDGAIQILKRNNRAEA
ncbi:MAG: glucokinase [Gammaproteobacteria bacterium]|nr:glucokinase [Gammaproteobacteria bacterium]